MKKLKVIIPLSIVFALALALFCVNRINTNKRREMALDTIRTSVIGYVFAGTYEDEHSQYDYVFTFVDEDTVKVKLTIKDSTGKITTDAITQDFGYRILVEKNSFKLKVGKAEGEISTLYQVSKLGPAEGIFMLTDNLSAGEDAHRAVHGIKMNMNGSQIDTFILDLKTPDKGSNTILLPGDIRLD